MNRVLDGVVVGSALLASVIYALLTLGPQGMRRRILSTLARLAAHAPSFLRSDGIARRLREASARAASACGGCESRGSEESAARAPASDVRVPVPKIGKRG